MKRPMNGYRGYYWLYRDRVCELWGRGFSPSEIWRIIYKEPKRKSEGGHEYQQPGSQVIADMLACEGLRVVSERHRKLAERHGHLRKMVAADLGLIEPDATWRLSEPKQGLDTMARIMADIAQIPNCASAAPQADRGASVSGADTVQTPQLNAVSAPVVPPENFGPRSPTNWPIISEGELRMFKRWFETSSNPRKRMLRRLIRAGKTSAAT